MTRSKIRNLILGLSLLVTLSGTTHLYSEGLIRGTYGGALSFIYSNEYTSDSVWGNNFSIGYWHNLGTPASFGHGPVVELSQVTKGYSVDTGSSIGKTIQSVYYSYITGFIGYGARILAPSFTAGFEISLGYGKRHSLDGKNLPYSYSYLNSVYSPDEISWKGNLFVGSAITPMVYIAVGIYYQGGLSTVFSTSISTYTNQTVTFYLMGEFKI